ncbi:MAG: hypothetical protein RL120_12125, partial [Gammaproteobacteria bacterium]
LLAADYPIWAYWQNKVSGTNRIQYSTIQIIEKSGPALMRRGNNYVQFKSYFQTKIFQIFRGRPPHTRRSGNSGNQYGGQSATNQQRLRQW